MTTGMISLWPPGEYFIYCGNSLYLFVYLLTVEVNYKDIQNKVLYII